MKVKEDTVRQKHENWYCKSLWANEAWYPSPLYAPVHNLDDTPLYSPSCVRLMDGLVLNQKRNKNIRMSHSLK